MQQNHIDTGDAVITIGGDLPSKYCVHAVGPHFEMGKEKKADKLLYQAYKSIRGGSDEGKHQNHSFPVISSGALMGCKSLKYVAKIGIKALLKRQQESIVSEEKYNTYCVQKRRRKYFERCCRQSLCGYCRKEHR